MPAALYSINCLRICVLLSKVFFPMVRAWKVKEETRVSVTSLLPALVPGKCDH